MQKSFQFLSVGPTSLFRMIPCLKPEMNLWKIFYVFLGTFSTLKSFKLIDGALGFELRGGIVSYFLFLTSSNTSELFGLSEDLFGSEEKKEKLSEKHLQNDLLPIFK